MEPEGSQLDEDDEQYEDIPFDQWVKAVFDHPVEGSLLDTMDGSIFLDSSVVTVAYHIELFENCDMVLRPYSDAQLNRSLWLLCGPVGAFTLILIDDVISLREKIHFIESLYELFAKCFAVRCSSHLSHLDVSDTDSLNFLCYQWWDRFPTYGSPEEPSRKEIDAALLEVMRRILSLNSIACQESALHGLGHWHRHYPQKTEEIIDNFLSETTELRPELKSYVQEARLGHDR